MNRFIIGRLGAVSLLAALLAVGCAVEQSTNGDDDQVGSDSDGAQVGGIGTTADEQISAGDPSVIKHNRRGSKTPDNGICPGCGPLPDPWQMGPLPDPWSSSSGGSNGSTSSSGGSTSSSGGEGSSGGTKNGK